jgi:hypothetical protein
MAKQVKISRSNYDKIKSIIGESSCMADAYTKVQQAFNLKMYNSARKITNAVYHDYKYLKIIDDVEQD